MLGGAARFFLYLGLAGCVGGLVTALLLSRDARSDAPLALEAHDATERCRRLGLAGLAVIGIVVILRAWLQIEAFRDPTDPFWPMAIRVMGSTFWGYGFVLQLTGLVLSFLAFSAPAGGRWRPGVLAGIGAACLVAAPSWQGHAASVDRFVTGAMLADALHTAAFAVWIGTLSGMWLSFLNARGRSASADRAALVQRLIVRFSPLALACGITLALTGSIAAVLHLTAVADLWRSVWGRLLLAKLLSVGAVAAAGAYNWRVVTPRLKSSDGEALLRTGIRRELLLATTALILTAILTGTGTPGSD